MYCGLEVEACNWIPVACRSTAGIPGGIAVSVLPHAWYDTHAAYAASLYDQLLPISRQEWLADLLPDRPAVIFDVGAGSGRDARAFAGLGYEVVAIEPSSGLRDHGMATAAPGVRWVADGLPGLAAAARLGLAAALVCVNAVWQHVHPSERPRAFRKMVSLLKSSGLLVMTLRGGPDSGRGDHPVPTTEVLALARDHGMQVIRVVRADDPLSRSEVTWTNIVLRLPDDGAGALPLLRHLILSDAKSATYKLGLLRALCRMADGAAGLATDGEDHVTVPLGLVGLYWLRLYMPLIAANLPQAPGNRRGGKGLGFAGPGWDAMFDQDVSQRDLRIGATFVGPQAAAIQAALKDAVDHICRMPATFLTYPGGGRILDCSRSTGRRPAGSFTLGQEALESYGVMRVPRHLWTAMAQLACWIEPALVSEWTRLVRTYATSQGRSTESDVIAAAMAWSDPDRDVAISRSIAVKMMQGGREVRCVWSGKRLGPQNLDVDHCLPWSAWPCGDLWNLMPADRTVNQHSKRDRLPSSQALQDASARIEEWWSEAYLSRQDGLLPGRFLMEAQASLPALSSRIDIQLPELFAAVDLQRLRLRQNQRVPEWGLRR